MRKIMFLGLMLIMISLIGLRFFKKDLFFSLIKIRSIQANKGKDEISELKKKAAEYEEQVKKKVAVADKLGKVYERLGKKYLEHKNWKPAVKSLENALEHGYNNPVVNYSLGVAYANLGKSTENMEYYEKSVLFYKKAIAGKKKYIEARYGLGLVQYYGKKDQQAGQKEVEKVVFEFPQFFPARFALGRIFFEKKQYAKSLEIYQSLYSDFENKADSKKFKKEKENLRDNIKTVMAALNSQSR